jgi:hypothetical protein
MGDSGEGLVDAESRIQERREELERQRQERLGPQDANPERTRAVESLKLARIELTRQLENTTDERRRTSLTQALAELDRRITSA